MITCKYSKYYCIKNKKGGDFSPTLKVLYPYFYLPFFVAEYSALNYPLLLSVPSYNYPSAS